MTTAEHIVCNVLNCGELDIETMFGKMTESGLFYDAFNELKDSGCHITANSIWAEGIRIAIERVFGEECFDDFDIRPNAMCSDVKFLGDGNLIDDYDEKVSEFYELTGFDPTN